MALNVEHPDNNINSPNGLTDELFYAIIDRLKAQKALPRDSFTKEVPFFNFSSVTKEAQVKELFQDISDPSMYRSLIKNIISIPDEKNTELINKRLSAMQVMGFAQLILYKVLPCEENCPNRPREVATHNQYKDYEYECPFYHHEKDKRRMVLTPSIDEEFIYKANYFEEGKRMPLDKEKYSQNYFESMFHPLYYKMFRCKREYCNFSQFCPFYHSEEEKKTWDRVFSNFIRKDRITYVKDKQKYYEHNSHNHNIGNTQTETRILRAGTDQNQSNLNNAASNQNVPNYANCNNQSYRSKNSKFQGQSNHHQHSFNEWRSERGNKSNSGKKWDHKKKSPVNSLKDSEELYQGNVSPVHFSQFCDQKEGVTNRVY